MRQDIQSLLSRPVQIARNTVILIVGDRQAIGLHQLLHGRNYGGRSFPVGHSFLRLAPDGIDPHQALQILDHLLPVRVDPGVQLLFIFRRFSHTLLPPYLLSFPSAASGRLFYRCKASLFYHRGEAMSMRICFLPGQSPMTDSHHRHSTPAFSRNISSASVQFAAVFAYSIIKPG